MELYISQVGRLACFSGWHVSQVGRLAGWKVCGFVRLVGWHVGRLVKLQLQLGYISILYN